MLGGSVFYLRFIKALKDTGVILGGKKFIGQFLLL